MAAGLSTCAGATARRERTQVEEPQAHGGCCRTLRHRQRLRRRGGREYRRCSEAVTVQAITKDKVVPNRYFQDGLRWNKDVYTIKSGGTITVVNNAAAEGPHTFTVVKEKDLPKTLKQMNNCAIC